MIKREVKNMCESNVYLIDKNGKESLYFELVDKIVPGSNTVLLENILDRKRPPMQELRSWHWLIIVSF